MTISLDSLSIHGIGRVALTKVKVLKVFWTLVFVGCLYWVCVKTYHTISLHFEYNSYLLTTTEVKHALQLPAITICNGLRLHATKNASLFTRGFTNYTKIHLNFCMVEQLPCNNTSLTYEVKKEPDTLPSCLVFNRKQSARQSFPVQDMGLRLDFFLNTSDTLSTSDENFQPPSMAVKIFLHSKEAVPLLLNSAASAKPGFSTEIVIQKVKISRLTSPFRSNCTANRENSTNFYPGNYTLNGCMLSQLGSRAYEKCGFVQPILKKYFPRNSTQGKINFTCLAEVSVQTHKTNCHPPCWEEKYKIISRDETKWPFGEDLQMLKDITYRAFGFWPTDEYIMSSYGRISISYDKLEELHHTEKEHSTTATLLSDIGGLMGIFLGASLISVAEILIMGSSLLFNLVTKIKVWRKENYDLKTPSGETHIAT